MLKRASWRDIPLTGSVLVFALLTYLVSWICFIGSARSLGSASASQAQTELSNPLYLVGVFAPAFVALALTASTGGRAGVLALLGRISPRGVGARWYLFAVAFMPAIKLTAAVLHRGIAGAWPRFGVEPWYAIAAAIVFSTPFQAGEEIGWRGYALPRLAARIGRPRASIVVGVIWAAWHLPFFFIPGVDKTGQSFPVFTLQVTALSVVLAWLYWRTNGNLLITMLMHSAVNQTTGIVPSTVAGATNPFTLSTSLIAWLTLALLWIAAGYLLIQLRSGVAPAERSATLASQPSAAAR